MTENRFQDTPQHETGKTSSIGGLWPPEAGSFRRIKGIYNIGTITTGNDLNTISSAFVSSTMRLSEREFIDKKLVPPTRVQFRAVVEAGVLLDSSDSEILQNVVEAIVPLDSGHLGINPVLVYFGKNSFLRQSDQIDLHAVHRNIFESSQVHRRSYEDILHKANTNGYQLEVKKLWNQHEVDQLSLLYERFGLDKTEVFDMVNDPKYIFCIAKNEEEIVSAGIAETAQFKFGQSVIRMVEITEAATKEGHGGKGLYTAVSTTLLLHLANLSQNQHLGGEIDLVFGECNGLSLPVLKTAKIQGRMFATETGEAYGFPKSGILKQQVPITGPAKSTEYNDLVPAFLSKSKLYEYYGK